jgi:hypothetical protein
MKKYAIAVLCLCCFTLPVFAEDNIVPFEKDFAFNFYGLYTSASFSYEESPLESSRKYTSELPWNAGVGLRYKDISARLLVPIEFPDKSFDFQINSYYEKMYYEAFLKRYNGFYNNKLEYTDLDILSAGISAGWIHNSTEHSLSAIYHLDRVQRESSGSFLYGFGAYYTSIYAQNEMIEKYQEKQYLVYAGPSAGYSYTWVFSTGIFFNINLLAGINAGIDTNTNKFLFIPQIIPKIALGHHNEDWSIGFIGGCHYIDIQQRGNANDSLYTNTITLVFSRRF